MAFRRTRDDTGCFVKQSSMARPGGAEAGTIELALVFVPRRGEALGERSGKRGDCQSIPESFALSLRLLDLHRCFSHSLSCAGFSLHTSLEASAANTGAVSHAAARPGRRDGDPCPRPRGQDERRPGMRSLLEVCFSRVHSLSIDEDTGLVVFATRVYPNLLLHIKSSIRCCPSHVSLKERGRRRRELRGDLPEPGGIQQLQSTRNET